MNLARTMKWSNGLLFISAFVQALTGALLFLGLNPTLVFPGAAIHKYNGVMLAGLIVFHIIINWTWFKTRYFRRS